MLPDDLQQCGRGMGRGCGIAAIGLAPDFTRTFPCRTVEACDRSYAPDSARILCLSMGFEETGGMDGDGTAAALRP